MTAAVGGFTPEFHSQSWLDLQWCLGAGRQRASSQEELEVTVAVWVTKPELWVKVAKEERLLSAFLTAPKTYIKPF